MATITSSILALLAAAPEAPKPQILPVPAVAFASVGSSSAASGMTRFELHNLSPADATATGDDPEAEEGPPQDEDPGGVTIDEYGALNVVRMKNMAGMPIPTALPTAFPPTPKRGLFADTFTRRTRYSARGGGPTPAGEWELEFHGYLRAPFRMGVSPRRPVAEDPDDPQLGDLGAGQSTRSVHAPVVPDEQYLSYAYTVHNARDWAELYLSYGNGIVTGTVSIQGFNFSDASWKEDGTQFGIAQAFVTLTPKFKARWAKLLWKVGSFDNRYGGSGRYDAGDIETYLFGRTHAMGESLQVDFPIKDFTISVEHGVGATRPDPKTANYARYTLLHHAHIGLHYQNKVEFNVHWLNAFSREADRLAGMGPGDFLPAGKQHVVGPELRIDWGRAGYWYAGFSYINLKDSQTVSRAIEVIHSLGAGQFSFGLNGNYLNGDDNGEIFSVIGQVEHSIQKARKGSKWYGQGPDLTAKVYFMLNKVLAEDEAADGDLKYKVGFDLLGTPLPWLGIGFRMTHVDPDSDYDEQRFTIFSPRLAFRTNFITHESIEIQYSRYVYAARTCPEDNGLLCTQAPPAAVPPEGFGSTPDTQDAGNRGAVILPGTAPFAPDENVILMKISMWW